MSASRKTAIVLTPRTPWPLDDGGRIGLWQVLWSTAQAYRTILVTLVSADGAADAEPPEVAELGIRVVRVPHRPPGTIAAAWRGITGAWPYTLERYRSDRLRDTVRELVATERPALVVVNHLHLYPSVADLPGVPLVLREHNVEFSWMRRYAQSRAASPAGWYASGQVERLRAAEAEACRRSALVLAVQAEERDMLRALAPGARIETLPIGIDLRRYPAPRPSEPPTVLIAGAYNWAPNAEGATRFLGEGWRHVAAQVPGARLRVVGKDAPAALLELGRQVGAEVVGYVDSMTEEFANASALVVPLWVGAGARVKIVEAFASRLPVVSTSLGAEGLELEPGRDYAPGETPMELAESLVQLLGSRERREALASRGRQIAEERWDLRVVARRQNELCAEVER